MNADQFAMLSAVLKQRSGLALTPDKQYLIESRLAPVMEAHRLPGLSALVLRLRSGDEALSRAVCEAMATHESSFFRDRVPFDLLRNVILPRVIERNRESRQIRIWSAACATGQEPYSLAMLVKEEAHRLAGFRVEILATDFSTDVLGRARAGIYTQFDVQRGLPIQLLVKHFRQHGPDWEVDPQLRAMISFRPFNLLEDFRVLGRFDIVFCRNVLIYFDMPTKRLVLERMAGCLTAPGALFLGSAETALGITDRLALAKGCQGVYEPAPQGAGIAPAPLAAGGQPLGACAFRA